MARIGIVGQYGWGNIGDEAVLQSVMDALGIENEFIISTNIPFTMLNEYHRKIPNATDVRTVEDSRTDFDMCLYGGGKVEWGFAWDYFIRAFINKVPTMAYGISLRTDIFYCTKKLQPLFYGFFLNFNAITVRDGPSNLWLKSEVTMCPAINLKEEKTSFEAEIIACPRYGDFDASGKVNNEAQIGWFVNHLEGCDKNAIALIPFHPKDLEGSLRDLELCQQINKRLGGGCRIFPSTGFNARQVKYVISKSKHVLSGGRYHAILWAIAYGIPYEIYPNIEGVPKLKMEGLRRMKEYFPTAELLKEREQKNAKMFREVLEASHHG